MADRFWGVPFAPEVDTFEAEVCRDQNFMAPWNTQHGSVIADSDDDRMSFRSSKGAAAEFSYA
jgi:hypothetical protein